MGMAPGLRFGLVVQAGQRSGLTGHGTLGKDVRSVYRPRRLAGAAGSAGPSGALPAAPPLAALLDNIS